MKAGWEVKALGDVCEFIGGGTPPKDKPEFYSGQIPWATVRDMMHDHLTKTDHSITEAGLSSSSSKLIPKDEIVIASRVGLGKVCILGQDTAINQDLRAVIPRDANSVEKRFLFHWFKFVAGTIEKAGTGATVKGVKLPFLKSLQIPLPPLAEQKRIVSILDEAFEGLDRARENAEANLKSARELFESALNTQITSDHEKYGTKQISKLCETIVDCLNRTAPKVPGPTDYKMVRTTNIRNGKLNLAKVNYVEESTYKTWTRRQTPTIGDVLLTREAPMGEAAIVDTEDKIFLGQRVVSYRTKSDLLDPDYLLFCFQSKSMQDEFSRLGSGATVQHIRVPQSKDLLVSCPPINEQSNAVSRLKQLLKQSNRLQFVHQTKLQDISDLRQSLLQKAFAGELT